MLKSAPSRLIWPLMALTLYYVALRGLPARVVPETAPEPIAGCLPPAAVDLPVPVSDVPLLERCATTEPYDAEVMRELGRAYETQQQWTVAERWYERALALNPDDGDVHLRLGRLLLQRRDWDGAATQAAAALRTQPGGSAASALALEVAAGRQRGESVRSRP